MAKRPTRGSSRDPIAGVEMQVSPECNLMILRRSRHRPAPGDVFVANALGTRWIVGNLPYPPPQWKPKK